MLPKDFKYPGKALAMVIDGTKEISLMATSELDSTGTKYSWVEVDVLCVDSVDRYGIRTYVVKPPAHLRTWTVWEALAKDIANKNSDVPQHMLPKVGDLCWLTCSTAMKSSTEVVCTGVRCDKCGGDNEYAQSNLADGGFRCYGCRMVYGLR